MSSRKNRKQEETKEERRKRIQANLEAQEKVQSVVLPVSDCLSRQGLGLVVVSSLSFFSFSHTLSLWEKVVGVLGVVLCLIVWWAASAGA